MFQKFYTDTLGGRFIKSLLAQTHLPLFESVIEGNKLVEGCYYVYNNYIIKCTHSGILSDSADASAVYTRVAPLDNYDFRSRSVFRSSTNYYDSETHKHLGKYLRYLRTTTGLNLLPYYNCYNSTYFSDVELSIVENSMNIYRVSEAKQKVVAIPILFGRSYTVALDCPTQVLMRACIHDTNGFVDEESLPSTFAEVLKSSGMSFSNLRFNSPVIFRIDTEMYESMMFQNDLYLVIQLPVDNDSSIVVLEDYASGTYCNRESVRQPEFYPSLLRMNTRQSYAFSDRLIEYLLGNVVSKNDLITQNISKVQSALGTISSKYNNSLISNNHTWGVWDEDINKLVRSIVDTHIKDHILYDQDDNINKDIEFLIYSRGGN